MATYIAFVIGLTLGAAVALLVLSLMVVGARSEQPPPDRAHYFAVLDMIERESMDIEPAARRALNRLHSKVLGMAQAVPPSVRQHVQD